MDELESLYERYADRVFNTVLRIIGDYDEAMDVTQEVFLRAHRGMHSFRGASSAYTWLFRIALNCAYAHLRRYRQHQYLSLNPDSDEEEVAVEDCNTEDGFAMVQESEMAEIIQKALLKLPEELRTAVVLRDIEGLSYEELAEVADCPFGTAKSRVHRGREMLRGMLRRLLRVEQKRGKE